MDPSLDGYSRQQVAEFHDRLQQMARFYTAASISLARQQVEQEIDTRHQPPRRRGPAPVIAAVQAISRWVRADSRGRKGGGSRFEIIDIVIRPVARPVGDDDSWSERLEKEIKSG